MDDSSSSSLEKKKTFMQQINADNTSHSLSSHLAHRRSSHTCAHTHTHTKPSSCCHLHHMRAVLMAGIERRQTLLEVVITVGEQLHRSDKRRCDVDRRHFGWRWEGLVPKFISGTKIIIIFRTPLIQHPSRIQETRNPNWPNRCPGRTKQNTENSSWTLFICSQQRL